ncbi:MAG TPA: nucleotidyltransferase family protein [Zeimonas sp.]
MRDRGHPALRAGSGAAASLCGLVAAALRDPPCIEQLLPRQLDLLLRALRRSRLLGRLAWQLREAGRLEALPAPAIDQLLGALALAESQQRAASWELDRVAYALRGMPTAPLVALKGCAYALCGLPNARGRFLADVDVLVPRAQLAAVEDRLRSDGWRSAPLTAHDERYYRSWSHEIPPLRHEERGIEVDLHHNIVMSTARQKPDARLLLADARPLPGQSVHVLSPVDMALHAMTHLMSSSDLADALRELVDIDDLLRHFAAHEPGFWDRLWPRAEALDLARPAFHALRQAHRCLGTPVPRPVLAASSAAAPPAPVLQLTDRLMPLALFPMHPDRRSHAAQAARVMLYLRSHWIRMPAPLLVRHLGHKLRLRMRASKTAPPMTG